MLKNLIASISLLLGLLLFYYSSIYKKYDYSFFTSSIAETNVEKLKKVESVFLDIYKDGKISNLLNEKEQANLIFVDKILIFQKNIIENKYLTLQTLFTYLLKTYSSKEYKASIELVERMKIVVRESSLASSTKLDLFSQIKDVSQSLNDIAKFENEIVNLVSESEKKLNTSIDDFSKDLIINNSSEKIKKIENGKYLLNIIAFSLLIFGLINFLLEYIYIRRSISEEVKILTETCSSIKQGSDADILLKLKKLRYFKKLKNNIFETIKILSNKLEFFKDFILDLKIPIMLKDDEGNILKNSEFDKLEADETLDFFLKHEKYYEKQIQGFSKYYCFISRDSIRKNLDKDIILDIQNSDYSKISPGLKDLILKIKEADLDKKKYISKYNRLKIRLRDFVDKLRLRKIEDLNYCRSLENSLTTYKETILKTKNLSDKIIMLKDSIKDFINNFNQIDNIIEDANNNKEIFSKNVEGIENVIKEFNYSLNVLNAFYKNLLLKDFENSNTLLEVKARVSNGISELTTFRQMLFKFKTSSEQISFIDKNKFSLFENIYDELVLDLESIKIFFEKNV